MGKCESNIRKKKRGIKEKEAKRKLNKRRKPAMLCNKITYSPRMQYAMQCACVYACVYFIILQDNKIDCL